MSPDTRTIASTLVSIWTILGGEIGALNLTFLLIFAIAAAYHA